MVTWFIFVMQFMWVWIDEFIGKGLDVLTILSFLGLLSTTLVPIALPLGILFAAIMTYGNLGETSELVAVKSSGISIARFTRPLFLFVVLLTVASYFFNNNIIPKAQLKATRLLYDIQNKKPVVAIKPGTFYKDIPNHVIYISSKGNDGKTVKDIKIFDHTSGRGNDKVTIANSGKMYVSEDKRFLVFELYDGWRYEEKLPKGKDEHEQIRLGFKYWKKVFDLSDFKMPQTDESYFKNLKAVMSVRQILKTADTTKILIGKTYKANKELIMGAITLAQRDTMISKKPLQTKSKNGMSMLDRIPYSMMTRVLSNAEVNARSVKSMLEVNKQNLKLQRMALNDNLIEVHKRFTLPSACIFLFIIGAALGSIIRKGGLGMPFIAAVIFFVLYYFLNTVGEKMAKEMIVPVYAGMWMPSAVLAIIGTFLLYKANNDSPLMNKEWYFRIGERIFRKLNIKRK